MFLPLTRRLTKTTRSWRCARKTRDLRSMNSSKFGTSSAEVCETRRLLFRFKLSPNQVSVLDHRMIQEFLPASGTFNVIVSLLCKVSRFQCKVLAREGEGRAICDTFQIWAEERTVNLSGQSEREKYVQNGRRG